MIGRRGTAGVTLLLALVAAVPAAAGSVAPALLERAARAPGDSVTVWVAFRDKGVAGAGDLASRLAAAERGLAPRARARRIRAGLTPLLDHHDLPVDPRYLDALAARGLRPFAVSRWLNRAAVRSTAAAARAIAALPFVAGVREVERVRRSRLPAAPPAWPASGPPGPLRAAVDYGQHRDPLVQIGVPALHDSGYTGAGLLIAVFDEEFNQHETHEALIAAIPAPGHRRDFHEGDTVVTDLANPSARSHGTWTFGIMAGNRPGTYVGAAFGAEFALARTEVLSFERPVEMLYWAQAAEWADSLGADLINSSLGYFAFDDPFPDYAYEDMDGRTTDVSRAAQIAASRGILVVNSVGNQGDDAPWRWLIAPADVHGDSLLAVGAVNAQGVVAGFSSYGPTADGRVKPDLAARGVANPLISPAVPDGYETGSGTSFAAPLVTGLAACLWQARPAWRAVDVIRALRETASRAGTPDHRIGYGIPHGARALSWDPAVPPLPPGSARLLGPNPIVRGGPPARVRLTAAGVQSGPQRGRVRVLDTQGRDVASLWNGTVSRGEPLDVAWDGRDHDGRHVPPGLYYIALTAGGERVVARIVALH